MSRALPRRALVAATGLALVAASLTALSSPSSADTTTPTDLYVVGTSDVSDSGLITSTSKLTTDFEAKYPYNLLYTGTGTGNAIATAEAGGAAALIVHAPSLENNFVASGFSEQPFGDALFWGDFVLLGPTSDPAGVMANAATNPIQAFEDIAAAGVAGKAQFVSRGSNPGTTVAEHQIWAQTSTPGVNLCKIDASPDGGGEAPTTNADGSSCMPSTQSPPSWYEVTGAKQAANIQAANACNFGSATNDCYVLTDRGTYDYLETQGAAAPSNLQIVTQNTEGTNGTASTPTGQLLVNTFHGYVINPSSVPANSKTDVTGATDFLNFLTSAQGQADVNSYLQSTGEASGPFIKDAAPQVTLNTQPATVTPRHGVVVKGSLTNVVPGTPALSGVTVQLLGTPTATPSATPTQVGTAVTDSSGNFSISYSPTVNMTYSFLTPDITKIEYPALNPQFSDQLQSTTTSLGEVDVQGVVKDLTATGAKNHLTVKGTTNPKHYGSTSFATLYARPAGSTQAFAYHGRQPLKAGFDTFHATYYLKNGKWDYYVRYANPGYILTGQSPTKTATVS